MVITHDFMLIDNCEYPSKWTAVGDGAVSLNTTNYIEGAGALNIYKPNTTQTLFGAELRIGQTINLQNKVVTLWVYIRDIGTLSKISSVKIYFYDVNGNYGYFELLDGVSYYDMVFTEPLRTGWNPVRILVPIKTKYSGGNFVPPWEGKSSTDIDVTQVSRIRIEIATKNPSDTVSEGEIAVDAIFYGSLITVSGGTQADPMTLSKAYDQWDKRIPVFEAISSAVPHYRVYCYIYFRDYITLENSVLEITGFITDYNTSPLYSFMDSYTMGVVRNMLIIFRGSGNWWRNEFISISNAMVNFENVVIFLTGGGSTASGGTATLKISLPSGYYLKNVYIQGYWHSGFETTDMSGDLINVTVNNLYNVVIARYSTKRYNINLFRTTTYPGYGGSQYFDKPIIGEGVTFGQVGPSSKNVLYDPVILATPRVSGSNVVVEIWYSVKAQIKDLGDIPVSNATVEIYDDQGNLLGRTTTDSNGWMQQPIYVLRRRFGYSNSVWIDEMHKARIRVTKDSTVFLDKYFEVDNPFYTTTFVVNTYKATAYPHKTPIQLNEPVTIYSEFSDWSNTPLTGLTVTATITKPDGSTVSINLTEYEPGKYSGTFTGTDQVGTYTVVVSTTIQGNTVSTKTVFDVGRLEQMMEKVMKFCMRQVV